MRKEKKRKRKEEKKKEGERQWTELTEITFVSGIPPGTNVIPHLFLDGLYRLDTRYE
jgi:hypothetical protein